jgi:nicotinamide-nucleotide adenylyltransferase
MKKSFELGLVLGRFQTFHKGHEFIIDKAVEFCDNVCVLVGSSQESGTLKNPFSYEIRERLLKKIYGDKIKVFPLPDIGVGNNSAWGEYVLKTVKEHFNRFPDLLVSGKEERRISWFDGLDSAQISELYVPKILDVSATKMREYFIDDNRGKWESLTNEKLWDEYESLRREVLDSKDNTFTSSI